MLNNPLGIFASIKQAKRHREEVASLAATLAVGPKPEAATLVTLTDQAAKWRISIPDQPDRFMSAAPTGHQDDEIFVVRVHADAFYAAWLKTGSPSKAEMADSCVVREDMRKDRKFKHAENGFACGKENPVPLPMVSLQLEDGKAGIRFTDGVTRCFWLLANKAKSFPVQIRGRDQAERLNAMVGLDPKAFSLAEVFSGQMPGSQKTLVASELRSLLAGQKREASAPVPKIR